MRGTRLSVSQVNFESTYKISAQNSLIKIETAYASFCHCILLPTLLLLVLLPLISHLYPFLMAKFLNKSSICFALEVPL